MYLGVKGVDDREHEAAPFRVLDVLRPRADAAEVLFQCMNVIIFRDVCVCVFCLFYFCGRRVGGWCRGIMPMRASKVESASGGLMHA